MDNLGIKINRIVTVIGNRPQFIKMAPVSRALADSSIDEVIIHTGQHFDHNMSSLFFEELGIPEPGIRLQVRSPGHAGMTAQLLVEIETQLVKLSPKVVLVYGDTNSTLAGALAAAKLQIPVAHVEAGPRLRDLSTPEEVNRVCCDHISTLLYPPDLPSYRNLVQEGLGDKALLLGDTMLDTYLSISKSHSEDRTILLERLGVTEGGFYYMTLHRPANVDSAECLEKLVNILKHSTRDIVFALHPRTRKSFIHNNLFDILGSLPHVKVTEPLGYKDSVTLLNTCHMVVTDSGGLQKEAFFAKKIALVMYDTSPWPSLVADGWVRLLNQVPHLAPDVLANVDITIPKITQNYFGNGSAGLAIASSLAKYLERDRDVK